MAHKYEHVSTGNGYWVKNGSTRTQVIAQDGSILTPVTTTDLTTTGNTILGNSTSDTVTISGRVISNAMPAGYTTPTLGVGVYGTPVVDTTLIDNIAFTSNMSTGTNKTAADSSCMAAYVGMRNTAATANNKLQGLLVSTTVPYNCFDAYGVQGHIALTGDLTANNGGSNNGNLCGVSAKASVTTGKTVVGTVSGLLITMDGGGTVTGSHQGLRMDTTDVVLDQAFLVSGAAYATLFALSEGTAVVNSGTVASGNGVKIAVKIGSTTYWINAHPTSNN